MSLDTLVGPESKYPNKKDGMPGGHENSPGRASSDQSWDGLHSKISNDSVGLELIE